MVGDSEKSWSEFTAKIAPMVEKSTEDEMRLEAAASKGGLEFNIYKR